MSLQQFRDSFDPNKLRENHTLDLKLRPDQEKCWLPTKLREHHCNHHDCRQLRNAELASDFSQFANADGGFLLFGVSESTNGNHVVGLDDIVTVRRHIENVIKTTCTPIPLFESLEFKYEDRFLLVFRIFPSISPIWTKCPRDTVKIVRRIDETKLTLGPSQIEEFINDMSRANQIRIKNLFNQQGDNLSTDVELVGGVIERYEDLVAHGGGYGGGGDTPRFFSVDIEKVTLTSCNMDDFEIQFEGGASWRSNRFILPYTAIKHVWRTEKGRIGLVLDLQIIKIGSELRLNTTL